MALQQSKRAHNRADKRARITAAARALFTAKGYEAATMREVARSAGVASGTVFTYARTKDTLLLLVFHDEMLDIVERGFADAMAIKGADLVDRLMTYFGAMVSYHEQDRSLAQSLMRGLGHLTDDEQRALVAELMRNLYERLGLLIEEARKTGEVSDSCPIHSATRTIFSTYYLHLIALLNGVLERAFFDRLLRSDLRLLVSGLRDYGRSDD